MALPAPASSVPVALLALAVLGSSAWACLLCFSTFTERLGVCRIFTGVQGPGREKCQKAFAAAFSGLEDSEINYDERSHLHDSFSQMIHSLQEAATAQGSYEVAFRDAAEKMKEVIARLKGVQACIPPCGLQEVARRFHCRGCFSTVCDLPLDCPGEGRACKGEGPDLRPGLGCDLEPAPPVQDVTVTRGDQALFSCAVNFPLPEEITYSWKFAAPDTGYVLLPKCAAGPRIRGADPAGAAQAPRDLLMRDQARPAPPSAPLLLS
ncbi:sperm acrosome membrane-associated protein 6 isoform X4 [Tupaia chinensis]|uniref:sperm acrosome membrane-associated protein 6 isoform X4 n=1 Tax=Tupaia chinensis TaxID=246437 RepID=UPI000703E336|nr:sperm acrosome membrane-associated protein 6 isoform X4 [Tupaia chinensis]XP_014446805.1 sperm acrosome membrane-associated protein 6 isoform X4 [Tupaia chinensis]